MLTLLVIQMKKLSTLFLVASIVCLSQTPANAADNAIVTGTKKVGSAIVWPFKKIGQGLKGLKNKVSK